MSPSMRTKIITAVVIIAIVVPPLLLGGVLLKILLGIIAVLSGYEIAAAVSGRRNLVLTVLNTAAIAVIYFTPETHFAAVTSIWLVLLFTLHLITNEKTTVDYAVYPFAMTLLVGLAMRCIGNIYSFDGWTGPLTMLYVCIACYACDTGAYFFGVFFGKHKMIPKVSPNKTWEGSAGGYLSGFILSLIFGLCLLHDLPVSLIITASLILPLTAQVGDLSFSAIKRHFSIKDFGKIFPGHGGVLDRVDSVVFCLMVFHSLMILWGLTA